MTLIKKCGPKSRGIAIMLAALALGASSISAETINVVFTIDPRKAQCNTRPVAPSMGPMAQRARAAIQVLSAGTSWSASTR